MCSCPAHTALVDCVCQCDHTTDRTWQYRDRIRALETERDRLAAELARGGEFRVTYWDNNQGHHQVAHDIEHIPCGAIGGRAQAFTPTLADLHEWAASHRCLPRVPGEVTPDA